MIPIDNNSNVTKGGLKSEEDAEIDSGDSSLVTWVVIGAIVVFFSVCGFASFKIWQAKRGPGSVRIQSLQMHNKVGASQVANKRREPSSRPKKEKNPKSDIIMSPKRHSPRQEPQDVQEGGDEEST